MSELGEFDKLVGKVAGAIYSDINNQFSIPPLMLVPAITFKVRKVLEQITSVEYLSKDQKSTLARDIQVSIIPMLYTYDIDAATVEKIAPAIEAAANKVLTEIN